MFIFLDITYPTHFYDNLMESYIQQYFQNSFPYHCDENVMEQSSSAKNPKMGPHIFITFLLLFDDISSAGRLIFNQIY